jgi:hypothetical protein
VQAIKLLQLAIECERAVNFWIIVIGFQISLHHVQFAHGNVALTLQLRTDMEKVDRFACQLPLVAPSF